MKKDNKIVKNAEETTLEISNVVKNDDGSVTINLAEPVHFGKETITEVTLCKPKGKHFKKVPVDPQVVGDLWPFACAICQQPPSFLDEMGAEDIVTLLDIVSDFMPASLQTGGTA